MRRMPLLIAFVSILLSPTIALGDTEPNDDFDTAEQIVAGAYEGELHNGFWPHDNEDFYKVTLVAGQLIYVNVTSTPETSVFLYDEQQEMIESSWTKNSHEVFRVTSSSAPPSFTYYIEIQRSSGDGSYTMEVSIVSQNDANSGGDAGDKFDTATLVTAGIRYSGYGYGGDDEDYYAVNIQRKCEVTVGLWNSEEYQAWVFVFDKERHDLGEFQVQEGAHDNATFEVSENQTIYVKLYVYGTYDFQITLNEIGDSGDGATDTSILEQFEDFIGISFVFFMFLVIVFIVIIAVIAYILKRR